MSPVYIKTRVTKPDKATGKTSNRFVVYYRRGGRGFPEEYGGSFKFKKEAATRRDLIAGELAAGRDPQLLLAALRIPPVPPPGLEEKWDAFIASRIDVGQSAHDQYGAARNRWLPILGTSRDPHTIRAGDIIAGIATLHATLSPSTIATYTSVLAQVLDFAAVEPNPARATSVKLPRRSKAEAEIPGNETWFAIRDQIKKRTLLCARLEEACALRVSEACALEWGDIDFIEGMARIRREGTKTAAGRRWVPVPPELLDHVHALLPVEDRHAHRAILGLNTKAVQYDLDKACTAAGAPEYGTHALRHRRISLWLRHGIDPVQVARWAGHSKPSESLNTYGHVILDPLGDEWRDFWLDAYAAKRAPGAAPVRHEDADA